MVMFNMKFLSLSIAAPERPRGQQGAESLNHFCISAAALVLMYFSVGLMWIGMRA